MKIIFVVLILCTLSVLIMIITVEPAWLSDTNAFLKDFISHEILSVYGIFVGITLGSVSHIHLTLNRMEEARGKIFFDSTRREIQNSCFCLVVLFCTAVISLVIKSHVLDEERIVASINAFNLIVLLLNALVLWDVTRTTFMIRADIRPQRQAGAVPEKVAYNDDAT